MPLYHIIETGAWQLRVREWRRQAVRTLGLLLLTLLGCTVGLLQRAGVSEVVVVEDLIAEVLVNRLGKPPGV